MAVFFYQNDSSPCDIEILVALPDGEGSGSWEEFMAEDFCDEDVLGHVFGFESVAADSGVGASQVAWFPGLVQRAEGVGDVLSLGSWGLVVVLTASGLGKPLKMRAGKGNFFFGRLKEALKKISAGRRPVRAMRAMPF